jgi:hypothetical protein
MEILVHFASIPIVPETITHPPVDYIVVPCDIVATRIQNPMRGHVQSQNWKGVVVLVVRPPPRFVAPSRLVLLASDRNDKSHHYGFVVAVVVADNESVVMTVVVVAAVDMTRLRLPVGEVLVVLPFRVALTRVVPIGRTMLPWLWFVVWGGGELCDDIDVPGLSVVPIYSCSVI